MFVLGISICVVCVLCVRERFFYVNDFLLLHDMKCECMCLSVLRSMRVYVGIGEENRF